MFRVVCITVPVYHVHVPLDVQIDLITLFLCAGNYGRTLAENADLYISRDGGLRWEQVRSQTSIACMMYCMCVCVCACISACIIYTLH